MVPLDPDIAQYLAGLTQVPGPSETDLGTARRVRRALAEADRAGGGALPIPEIRDDVVAGVFVRVYRPHPGIVVPTIVAFHSGGFVLGDLDTHDLPARLLATDAGAVVVSVEYALAPERPFPAAVDDAWAVLADVAARIGLFGGDADRLAVAGIGAGANLAAVTAVRARDEGLALAAQLLVCPTVDPAGEYRSRGEHAEGYLLTTRDLGWSLDHYLGVDPDSDAARTLLIDPRVAPLRTPDLAGLAPAVVATAEYDPVQDEGVAYAAALVAAGVPVWHRTFPGLIHGLVGGGTAAAARATHEAHAALADLLG